LRGPQQYGRKGKKRENRNSREEKRRDEERRKETKRERGGTEGCSGVNR
jgi:hypothetical protein